MFDLSQFLHVAIMSSVPEARAIDVTFAETEAADLDEAVYAWVTHNGEVIRIGTSKWSVRKRLGQYPGYINKALSGRKSQTPLWEAERWLEYLRDENLLAYVHQPPAVETVAGLVRPYLDVERTLLAALRPPLNRSHR